MKLNIINGSEIKKEVPNNNHRYIKLTKQDFEKLTSIRFISDKIKFSLVQNDQNIELSLPKLRNPKSIEEPAMKELIDCVTVWGFQKYANYLEQGRYRAKAEKMLLEEIDYQNEIQRLDNEVEELSQEKQYLIRELAKYKEKYGESI
jgi:hypothetical protein